MLGTENLELKARVLKCVDFREVTENLGLGYGELSSKRWTLPKPNFFREV